MVVPKGFSRGTSRANLLKRLKTATYLVFRGNNLRAKKNNIAGIPAQMESIIAQAGVSIA
jgi:hypothetical protein